MLLASVKGMEFGLSKSGVIVWCALVLDVKSHVTSRTSMGNNLPEPASFHNKIHTLNGSGLESVLVVQDPNSFCWWLQNPAFLYIMIIVTIYSINYLPSHLPPPPYN